MSKIMTIKQGSLTSLAEIEVDILYFVFFVQTNRKKNVQRRYLQKQTGPILNKTK